METVSVIIVTFNTCELTLRAIQSVYESRDNCAKEVVVVDNASRDNTEAAVRARFPEVKYHYSQKNLGFARANNLGVQLSNGEWVLLLNSDARLQPESLSIALRYMRNQMECGILGAQLLNEDGSKQNSIANFPTLATELLSKSLLRRIHPSRYPGKEHKWDAPGEVDSVIGAFLLTRRATWSQVGGLDERYFFFLEETDLCLQVRNAGLKIIHHPEVLVWHFQGGSAKQVAPAARIEYWRSRYSYFQKNAGAGERLLLKCGLLFRLVLNWILNGVATLLSFGTARKIRHRFVIAHKLLAWHFLGQPDSWGIPR